MKSKQYFNSLKIIVIGDSNIGKSSSIRTYSEEIEGVSPGIGFQHIILQCSINQVNYAPIIYDNGFNQPIELISNDKFFNKQGIMIMYSVSDRNSFDRLSEWIERINENCPKDVPKVIVGSKCDIVDINRSVSYEEGEIFSKSHQFTFFEVSSFEKTNIIKAFNSIIDQAANYDFKQKQVIASSTISQQVSNNKINKCSIF